MSSAEFSDDPRAGQVREGEGFDAAAVTGWLRGAVPGLDESVLPEVTQYSAGASNWTYRLRYLRHDFVLRRPPAGTKAKSAHDMGREYRVQAALYDTFGAVPEMIGLCEDEEVIGSEFYVMERLDGVIPKASFKESRSLSTKEIEGVCKSVLDTLVELHRVDCDGVGLTSLGKGPGYCRRQIEGWDRRYEKARTPNVPAARYVRDYLLANIPEDRAMCLIHNDYRFDNVVLDRNDLTKVIGVLDWEMSTIGDPLMDLGNSLAYWVQNDDDPLMRFMRRQPTHLPGMLSRREVVDYYCQRTGLKVTPDEWVFYEVYGLFRLAVIAQQIYYRYYHGQTRNKAFKNFWVMIHYLNLRCRRIIRRGR
jgi:aminoglycoside phosphotransferase (APT) family kinase protein